MQRVYRTASSAACLIVVVACGITPGRTGAAPSQPPSPHAPSLKRSEIPLAVVKDIQRVGPGMTRADLDWLFLPDGGFRAGPPTTYVYRYAHGSITALGAAGRPVLDQTTHKPVAFGQAIMIDVTFRPTTGQESYIAVEDGTGRRFTNPDGRPDDVIVSVSAPYVGSEHTN